MEDFKSAINVPNKEYFILQTLDFNKEEVVSLKKQEDYFPSYIYTIDGYNIMRTAISYVDNVDNNDDNQEQLKRRQVVD